jgi:3-deoxy-D-manno-octulosonic-acid transferase
MKVLNLLLWPFILPVLLLVYLFWPRSRPFFFERLGLAPMRLTRNGYLLFHVASLGEARAARSLISRLSARVPLILTAMTLSGRNALASAHPDLPVSLAPLDLPGIWIPFFRSRRIRGILLFETEIWPSMLLSARDQEIPVALLNGRLSSRSFRRYGRIKAIIRPLFRRLSPILVQTPIDQERFCDLGGIAREILVTGNLKWDVEPASLDPDRISGGRGWLAPEGEGINEQKGVLFRVMGSSVHPGEALTLFLACRTLRQKNIPVQCILAPRHLETLPRLLAALPDSAKVLLRKEDPSLTRTRDQKPGKVGGSPEMTVHVLNTYGEMGAFLALADAVFIGGTLDPVGGHSPVEAAYHGKPILWGPFRDHIADLSERIMDRGAALEVKGEEDLERALLFLAQNPDKREAMGRRSREVFDSEGGPLARTMSALEPFLGKLFPGVP